MGHNDMGKIQIMKPQLHFFAPDGTAPGMAPEKPKRVRGPFNKKYMAALDEAEGVVALAKTAPYAGILETKYDITPAEIAQLETEIPEARRLFGAARADHLGSQSQTDDKNDAEDAIIEAIDDFRTGARLTFKTAAEQEAFGIGVELERNEAVLAQLAQSILDNPVSPTLRGIGSDEMTALQTALNNWKVAALGQHTQGTSGAGTNADAHQLFDHIEEGVRDIKIAIDGKFSFRKPENRGVRGLFNLPLNRPFAPNTTG